jgi:hypothetical protein
LITIAVDVDSYGAVRLSLLHRKPNGTKLSPGVMTEDSDSAMLGTMRIRNLVHLHVQATQYCECLDVKHKR